MKCQQAKILISSFIDGELTNSEWQQVQSHVESCSTCSRTLAMFEESTALFKREMTKHRPGADLWSHIVERISEEERPSVFEVLKDKLKEFTLTFLLRPSPKIRYTQLSFAIIAIVAVFALFRRAPSTSDFIVEEKRSTRLALARDTNRHQYLQANVLKQVEKYFDRAGVLLLEVKNGTIDPQEDAINQVRQSSQKLLEETILVKENIKKSDAVRLKKIIEQLKGGALFYHFK